MCGSKMELRDEEITGTSHVQWLPCLRTHPYHPVILFAERAFPVGIQSSINDLFAATRLEASLLSKISLTKILEAHEMTLWLDAHTSVTLEYCDEV